MAYSEVQALGTEGCSTLLSQARETMLRLTSLSTTLGGLASIIASKAMIAQKNFNAVTNMRGLVSIPNEVLVRIFECTVNGDANLSKPARCKAAVTLSHVCQYFRDTALSCPQIWSNIGQSAEAMASLLSRSKDARLDVELTVGFGSDAHPHELNFEQLLLGTLPHSERWGSLEIQFVSMSRYSWDKRKVKETPLFGSNIRQAFRSLNAPSMESLHVKNDDDSGREVLKNYNIFAHWNTPNLRRVTAVYYFPCSLPGLANVTSLNLTLRVNQADLLKNLSTMIALEDLTLKLDMWSEPRVVPLFEMTEVPSIRRLSIETVVYYCMAPSLLKRSSSRPYSFLEPSICTSKLAVSWTCPTLRYADFPHRSIS